MEEYKNENLTEDTLSPTKNKIENQIQKESVGVLEAKIHTMPEKFLKNLSKVKVKKDGEGFLSGKKTKQVNKKFIILISSALIFLIILALVGWLFVKSISQNTDNNFNVEVKEGNEHNQINLNNNNNADNVEVCGADNCSACDKEQCLMLVESCHSEIVYEMCGENFNEECVVEKCIQGKTELPIEDNLFDEYTEETQPQQEEYEEINFVLAEDQDEDGLSYIEELIWKTNPEEADTDRDGYLDGKEVLNFYNPANEASQTLAQAGLVDNFIDEDQGFSFLYPKDFNLIQSESSNIAIQATTTSEFFNVLILENTTELNNIIDWFKEVNHGIEFNRNKFIGSEDAVSTLDNLNFYALIKNNIFVVSYGPDFSGQINFMTTFEMMVKSFKFFSSPF
ncbi:MAG: hypothetical protein ABIF17_01920 [Patescibacteria group bacterium]